MMAIQTQNNERETQTQTQTPKIKLNIIKKKDDIAISPKICGIDLASKHIINPKKVIKPILKPKTKPNNISPKIKDIKPVRKISIVKPADKDMCFDDSDSSSCSSVSREDTYICPLYGVNMRISMDNKRIYDIDFNLMGKVIDDTTIDWLDA